MAQVPSNQNDIRRAYQRHSFASRVTDLPRRSRFVSLFYAAECGLKYIIMSSNNVQSTNALRNSIIGLPAMSGQTIDLHNIEQLCLSANFLPVDVGNAPSSFTVNGTTFAPYKLHEAARYGVKIADPYLGTAEEWLQNIIQAISERIRTQGI